MTDPPDSLGLPGMRRDYPWPRLLEAELRESWSAQLSAWLSDAAAAGLPEPNAMILVTATPEGRPSARTVLLKHLDPDGLVFYTNLRSRKGRELEANPRAAAVLPFHPIGRQVIVEGEVVPVSSGESDAYFASRPRGARLGAVASPQSEPIEAEELEARFAEAAARYPEPEPIPRPDHWGGLRIVPDRVEFWQGAANRMHDRLRFRRGADGGFAVERLAP